MKAGVWMSPWGVEKVPARALSEVDSRVKRNGGVSDAYR